MKNGREIKKELKEKLGIAPSKLSVRVDYNSIDVTIKCPMVSLGEVKAIVDQYESISRCEYTGEILSGGNTYVCVNYEWELIGEMSKCEKMENGIVTLMKNGFCLESGFTMYSALKCLREYYVSPYGMASEMFEHVLHNILRKNYTELNLRG